MSGLLGCSCKDPGVPWAASFAPDILDLPNLQVLCDALTSLNVLFLHKARGRIPLLYQSGVRYEREKQIEGGFEKWWRTIPWILRDRKSDCKGLAAWRAAELTVAGMSARAVPSQEGPKLFHVRVLRSDGVVEDPSVELGMSAGRRVG